MNPPRVLLVDDEASVLSACVRLLHKEPYEVVTASSPQEALQKIGERSFGVVVSDYRMPEMEGTVLLEKIRAISPDTVRLMLTGQADIHAVTDAINRGAVYRFLTKPWNDEELRLTILQAVEQYQLVTENRRLQELTLRQNAELQELNHSLEKKVEERTTEIAQLNQELQKSFMATLQVLAEAAEIHSSLVGSHSKRVAALAKEIGVQMELSSREVFELEVAATLHDIGKLALAPELLGRPPSDLTPVQRETLRRHSVNGERLVAMVPHLGETPRIIRHHHEHCDGSGFPDGLRGQSIPLASRIIAAADAYDRALNSRAVFASATVEEALTFVQGLCPSIYDGDVVTVLTRVIREGKGEWAQDLEVEIRAKDLRPGLILSRELRTASGMLLFPADSAIQEKDVERILNFQETDPIVERIFVYRKNPPSQ